MDRPMPMAVSSARSLRDVALRGKDDLLDQVDLVFVPVLNIDGHERMSPWHFLHVRGPREKGVFGGRLWFRLAAHGDSPGASKEREARKGAAKVHRVTAEIKGDGAGPHDPHVPQNNRVSRHGTPCFRSI